ncbi:MAG TPA: hypothetical protein VLU95_01655, partial [Candidatus Acidoferrum sp.]|nr:hypothetical protein [Candidatus Acidoferrum sp.]
VFELEKFSYRQVIDAIRSNDSTHFKYTIEVDPAYGKYHWTGHRNCKVSLSPQEAIRFNNVCPVCRRELTKGVEQRVEELADRPLNFKREGAPGFLKLLPLSEIIATVLGSDSPSSQAVWKNYSLLVEKFGNEYTVLIDIPREALATVVDATIAQAIINVRDGTAKVTPGYDGVYGQLILDINSPTSKLKPAPRTVKQTNIGDFFGKLS